MTSQIVADGPLRLDRGKRKLAAESLEEKYAAELENASGPEEKERIRERMTGELLRRKKMLEHEPSPGSLW